MRLNGVIAVLVLVAIAFAVPFFITDDVIEENLEFELSVANGALVEIDELEFDLTGLHISWKRMQVTDPNNTMMNLFEIGETNFDIEFWPLLHRQVIIEEIKLTDFALSTERETDGSFEMPVGEDGAPADTSFFAQITREVSSNIARSASMEFNDVKDDINVDSLLATLDLQSIEKMEGLKNNVNETYGKWESTFTNNSIAEDADSMYARLNRIKINELKEIPKVVEAFETIKNVTKEADSIRRELQSLKTNFDNDLSNVRSGISSIDNWIRADIRRAENVAKLPEINAQSIGTALFGESLLADLNQYLEYIAVARDYSGRITGADEKEVIERYEGVDYHFTDKYDLPKFWAKKIELSGRTLTDIELSGEVTNLSFEQSKTGEPVVFNLSGKDTNDRQMTFSGEFNYLSESKSENFAFNYQGFSLQNSRISPSELLPYELTSGTGNIGLELAIVDKRIDGEINYVADGLNFDLSSKGDSKNVVENLIRRSIQRTNRIEATAIIDNTDGPLNARVRSNLDDIFLNTLRSTVQEEVNAAKRKIQNEVEDRVDSKKKEVEQIAREQEARLRAEYEKIEQQINDRLAIIEEKKAELEAKKKELENSLQDKAKDVLKKIGFN